MTGGEFVLYVKAKLNRLDTAAYTDVRSEEILFFGRDALQLLLLDFDRGAFSPSIDKNTALIYLNSMTETKSLQKVQDEDCKFEFPDAIKYKDLNLEIEVEYNGKTYTDTKPLRVMPSEGLSLLEQTDFRRSTISEPNCYLTDNILKVIKDSDYGEDDIVCKAVTCLYIKRPKELEEDGEIPVAFTKELQDKTVSLILENIENNRLRTQPIITK